MLTNEYMINKLNNLMPVGLKHLLTYMKDNGGMYIAGGALCNIATGRHDQIADWDLFFPSKESCIKAIRYMKEENPHVAFVSDKSITYKLKSDETIQFVYNQFYPKASDIFSSFDFTCVMAAYDCRDEKIYTHENFWMHNAQRFLSFNKGTSFPIISLLRYEKYRLRGYKISRNEMLKLSLAIASLNISSWEEAKKHIGNTYGFDLADFKDCENTPFSIEALIERIETVKDGEDLPHQTQYLYPHNCVDFILEGLPIEYIMLGSEKQFIDPYVLEAQNEVQSLIDDGILTEIEVDKDVFLKGKFYVIESNKNVDEEVTGWGQKHLYKLENLGNPYHNRNRDIYRVEFNEDDVKGVYSDYIDVSKYKIVEKVCRVEQLEDFKQGKSIIYRNNAKMKVGNSSSKGWAYTEDEQFQRGKIAQLRELRSEHIKNNILVTDKQPCYAHTKFSGVILEGGEDITATELLFYMDDWNLCFGGDIHIKENGTFSGRYNTD